MSDQLLHATVVVGTRPEAIKLAPVILEFNGQANFDVRLIDSGQHQDIIDDIFDCFDLVPDIRLGVLRPNQPLRELTARLLRGIGEDISGHRPDVVIVQGDTMTAFAAALAAFYEGVPVGHVEAGLRTGNLTNPFPEEANRALVARLAQFHFAPTERARAALLGEGIADDRIVVTGNTVVDALRAVVRTQSVAPPDVPTLLATLHRRESVGEPMRNVCIALRETAATGVRVVVPVHPNPAVSALVRAELSGAQNVTLTGPLPYRKFVGVLSSACAVVTDSGGVQEEASSLGVPLLVARAQTERVEGLASSNAALVDPLDLSAVRDAVRRLLAKTRATELDSPYGDGHAAQRIVETLRNQLRP